MPQIARQAAAARALVECATRPDRLGGALTLGVATNGMARRFPVKRRLPRKGLWTAWLFTSPQIEEAGKFDVRHFFAKRVMLAFARGRERLDKARAKPILREG